MDSTRSGSRGGESGTEFASGIPRLNSFTALLELPANQAVELLVHTPDVSEAPFKPPLPSQPFFHSNGDLVNAAKSPESNLTPSNFSSKVKREAEDSHANLTSNPAVDWKPNKRKERKKNGKASSKKIKTVANDTSPEDVEKLPYVHVRAPRGQATDRHSLAERARREKINARMKLLQELVPGCNKISGTAMVLDEIINHVKSLQHQVEYLSMRLAAVDAGVDFNLDALLAAENASSVESNCQGIAISPIWLGVQINESENRQKYQQPYHFDGHWGREGDNSFSVTPENELLSQEASANFVFLHSNQIKREP